MKTFVFVCNHERTISWNFIAKKIKILNKNINIIAIVYDEMASKLVDSNVYNDVIYLNKNDFVKNNPVFLNDLDFIKIKEKDRKLRFDSNESAIIFLKNIANLIEFKFNNLDKIVFFGEISWAIEELLFLYSKKRSFDYFTIITTRYINRRWAVVKNNTEERLIKLVSNIELSNNINSDIGFVNYSKPDYFYEGIKNLSFKNRLLNFIFKNGLKSLNLSLLKKKIIFILFNWFIELFKNNNIISSNKKYYLYAFQVQPEASVDYLAPEYINQFKLIDDIISKLKDNEMLILKDHPGETIMWGLVDKLRYLNNPKVIYLKTKITIDSQIYLLDGAITITGTIGGELAMSGLPTVSLKPVFYNMLTNSYYESSIILALERLRLTKKITDSNVLEKDRVFFYDYLKTHSFVGFSYFTKEFGFSDPNFIDQFADLIINNKF